MNRRTFAVASLLLLAGAAFVRIGGGAPQEARAPRAVTPQDFSAFSPAPPAQPLELLFIHHSCGGQLLAAVGTEEARGNCIYDKHPNGGGLRQRLSAEHYAVHEASYGSEIGEATDLFDWLPKFRTKMDKILSVELNDHPLPTGVRNQVVVFKSCFPNSAFVGV